MITFSGLDPYKSLQPASVYPNLIVHQGSIVAPSGVVTMDAVSRVYLAPGSLIDVSGLWLDEPASAGIFCGPIEQYNLRDYYLQQGGALQGQTVSFSQSPHLP